MRCLEFRVKKENGEWRHVGVTVASGNCKAETFGQFSGMTDKNGGKIYEGDIIRIKNSFILGKPLIGKVVWESGGLVFKYMNPIHGGEGIAGLLLICNSEGEIIGNIFDNPGLLDVKV